MLNKKSTIKKKNGGKNNEHDKTTGLYKIAAKIIKKVKTGSSYKTELYQAQYPNKLSLNAVLMNVFKWEKVLDVLIDKSNILEKENNMDRELVYVLITELMWSKFGLKGNAKNILAVKKYESEFQQLMKQNDDLLKMSTSMPTKVWKPRYFRINTLITTVQDVLKKLSEHKFKKLNTPKTYVEFLELIKSDKFTANTFVQDLHIKELLVFNSKVKFYKLEEYNNGSLIIQDKASCLAAYLLNPEPESTVLDMCAAPGMKTSHLAAIMQNKGKLYAVDRCKNRFDTMQTMLKKYGVKNVEPFNMDALSFPYYDDVKYILVDPSCSGSGIVDRVRNDSSTQNENFQLRLKKLANVHAQLLNHALKTYPNLERLVYSTCSANHEENEAVVDEALSVNGKFKLLDCVKMVKGWTNKGAPGYDCSDMCLNAVPSTDYTNGFFIAVFVRRDCEEKEGLDDNSEVNESVEEPDDLNIEEVENNNQISEEINESVEVANECNIKNEITRKRKINKRTKNETGENVSEFEESTIENDKIQPKKKKLKIENEPSISADEITPKIKKNKKVKNKTTIEAGKKFSDGKESTGQVDKIKHKINNIKTESESSVEPNEKISVDKKNNVKTEKDPAKKTKSMKRKERRLKLETANGVPKKIKIKKSKKGKTEETE